jgi:hypothetical protein
MKNDGRQPLDPHPTHPDPSCEDALAAFDYFVTSRICLSACDVGG